MTPNLRARPIPGGAASNPAGGSRSVAPSPYSGGVDTSALTPAQCRAVEELLEFGHPRPSFDPDLPLRLLDLLEAQLSPLADRLGPPELAVDKTALARVHQCERHHLAEAASPFSWSSANATGTVAHKALELSVFTKGDPSPLELADLAIERLGSDGGDRSPRAFLLAASPAELAELRSAVNDVVAKFQECFPPLLPAWRPRLESPCRVELCAGRVVLRSKVDLALGRPVRTEARVLIVDFKTGRPYHGHVDDLRYYALLETIRMGVPPFRVAAYYLESARWHHEDMTSDILLSTVRRVVAGVTKLVELRLEDREPTITAGPPCRYCTVRAECPGSQQWAEQRDAVGVDAF